MTRPRVLAPVTTLLVVAALALAGTAAAAPRDPRGAADAMARALAARKPTATTPFQPRLHTTDFALEHIGCILLPRGEMRRFGYPGHALVCEEAATGQVLGAVLDRRGRGICQVSGQYTDDDCYDLSICDYSERLCVH